MSSTQRILNAYRSSLRATKIAFNNDFTTLNEARNKIRQEIKSEKSISNPKLNIEERVELLEKVSEFLKHNIVQAVKKDTDDSRYVLNIHKDTELGDNEDIKVNKSTLKAGNTTGGCCGNGQIELQEKTN